MFDMIYNVDIITQACYRTSFEFGYGLYDYGNRLDIRTGIDNVIFQFGNVYDAVRDTILFFIDDDRGEFDLPCDAGRGIGTAIFLLIIPAGVK